MQYVNIVSRGDAAMAVFGPVPSGFDCKRPPQRCSALQEAHSGFALAPRGGLLQSNRDNAEFVHAV